MTKPKKRKWLALLCRSDVKDRMDLSAMWEDEPETFNPQQTALWNAMNYLDTVDEDGDGLVDATEAMDTVLTAMAAI